MAPLLRSQHLSDSPAGSEGEMLYICCVYKLQDSYFVSKHMKIYIECVYVYLPKMIQRNVLSSSVKSKLEKRIKRLLTMLSFNKCKSK